MRRTHHPAEPIIIYLITSFAITRKIKIKMAYDTSSFTIAKKGNAMSDCRRSRLQLALAQDENQNIHVPFICLGEESM